MTELLGNKICIDSLRCDLQDLNKVLNNVTSRVGHVNYTSWKYPDKMAVDVDVFNLLELCQYDEEFEEENKISHILLLELIIDRLVFFIQCSYRSMDQISVRAQSAVDSHSSSVGVVTKKYWTRFIQLQSNLQQLVADSMSQTAKLKELHTFNEQLQQELGEYHQGLTKVPTSAKSCHSNGCTLPPLNPPTPGNPSLAKDNSNRSSQTHETAFVPCEYCHKVQGCLKSVGDSMVNMCKTQGLQSSLAKYRKQIKGLDWYSYNDLSRWSVEQNKDLDRINKHLADLMATIEPLKEELSSSISTCRSLEKRVTECQHEVELEKETQRVQTKQHHSKIEAVKKEHEETKSILMREKEQLELTRSELEQKLKETRCELDIQVSKYSELNEVKQQLMLELEDSKTNNSEVKRLTGILSALEKEMASTKDRLTETETLLSQEQALSYSLSKRTESLQSKYDSLVRRLDEMDEENNALQSELSALAEKKECLEASLDELNQSQKHSMLESIDKERSQLQANIKSLEDTVTKLESDLTSMKEREKLLVEYPDLNGPVNPDLSGTGDILTDMKNQVKANEIRINLLDHQNSTMKKTLDKLTQKKFSIVGGRPPPPEDNRPPPPPYKNTAPTQPTQLWSHQSEYEQSQHIAERTSSAGKSSNKGKAKASGDSVSEHSWRHQPPTAMAVAQASNYNSSMDAYKKLKNAGLLKSKQQPSTRRESTREPDSRAYTCPNCDKMYQTAADLDLHKSYCSKR